MKTAREAFNNPNTLDSDLADLMANSANGDYASEANRQELLQLANTRSQRNSSLSNMLAMLHRSAQSVINNIRG